MAPVLPWPSQASLDGNFGPFKARTRYRVVLDETVLRRPIGGRTDRPWDARAARLRFLARETEQAPRPAAHWVNLLVTDPELATHTCSAVGSTAMPRGRRPTVTPVSCVGPFGPVARTSRLLGCVPLSTVT